ncbi:MAG: hypothetical protein GX278_04835 [Aeromonadales bacterium]|nr:hypothetical protein [Aeromonadales bacterium]
MTIDEILLLVVVQCNDTFNCVADKDRAIQKTLNVNFDFIEDRYNSLIRAKYLHAGDYRRWSDNASSLALTLFYMC